MNTSETLIQELENRHKKEMSILAGEPVNVKLFGNDLYVFASELGCLRIAYYFNGKKQVKVSWSKIYNLYYVAIYSEY